MRTGFEEYLIRYVPLHRLDRKTAIILTNLLIDTQFGISKPDQTQTYQTLTNCLSRLQKEAVDAPLPLTKVLETTSMAYNPYIYIKQVKHSNFW